MAGNEILLAKYLRELRESRRMKQEDVARMLGIKRQTYSHYETVRLRPSTEMLYKLSELYHIPFMNFVDILMGREESGQEDAKEDGNPAETQAEDIQADDMQAKADEKKSEIKEFISYLSGKSELKDIETEEVLFYYHNLTREDQNSIRYLMKRMYNAPGR